ncbi:Retrovirus-related Pol polyprotein from transposon TNT 1-94 [Gracilariopsis chorda]|uniref:Retrovirus-related Pol polyprotein from transposon TNT 1-94 n=1 Tax=Gracilariopsis chorda TaxID=448386 RepID=A0A2V3IKY7_9FLOR|nr:Retrovirus-related Pol polyprotein from transposon TNT 1-94 [Gracilariopsis chorda]|eukprot:PXF41800.1 Retrovirus-related Pol polyprotein from transposon TNT 1-94 [Gracilariopsis chorda]
MAKDMIKMFETQSGRQVKRFRFENVKEYLSILLTTWFKSKGVIHDPSPPYSPESIGKAKRLNRTLNDKVRSMLRTIDGTPHCRPLQAEASILRTIYETVHSFTEKANRI